MKKQFSEEQRASIEVELIYENKAFYGLRFVNHGKHTAQHVQIQLANEFIESLNEDSFQTQLQQQKNKECVIGVDQHYDIFIGSNKLRSNPNKKPVTGQVIYSSEGKNYQTDIYIDLENYACIYSVNTYQDDMLAEMKKQTKELQRISNALASMCQQQEADNNGLE